MASEIRVDKINSLSGVGTVTLSPTGVDIAGITTAATLRATTGIVTSLTAGSLTSLGAVSGTTGTFTSHVSLGDSDELRIGDGNDLKLYHNGNNSFIEDAGTGDFYIRGADNVRIQSYSDNEDMAKFIKDGAVELYHNNSKKIETTSGGVTVTGGLTATTGTFTGTVDVDGANITLGDNDEVRLGDSGDLQLFHNSSSGEGRIYNSNAAGLVLISNLIKLKNQANNETMIQATNGGAVELYHNDTKKVQTESAGITVFGSTQVDGSCHPYSDNASDLGLSSNRWQDLYLSGNIYLGGTGSANALNDYEEGTFTSTCTSGGSSITQVLGRGSYTKIGDTVYFQVDYYFRAGTPNGNDIIFGGLPFTTGNQATLAFGGAFLNYNNAAFGEIGDRVVFHLPSTNTQIKVYNSVTGNVVAGTSTGVAIFSSKEFILNGFYKTA